LISAPFVSRLALLHLASSYTLLLLLVNHIHCQTRIKFVTELLPLSHTMIQGEAAARTASVEHTYLLEELKKAVEGQALVESRARNLVLVSAAANDLKDKTSRFRHLQARSSSSGVASY